MALSLGYLNPLQKEVVTTPLDQSIFLAGPAGSGKTTVGVERLRYLLENGIPGSQILLFTPQRTLATPYEELLHSPAAPPGSQVTSITMGGLARRMVDLFWPLISEEAGFAYPDQPPVFLTLETAQYFMAHLVRPHLAEGAFDHLTIDRNRLYSQILDNLNKAAVHAFPHTEIGERLQSAWIGDPGQVHLYQDAQKCVDEFRNFCLAHNLLDFSLQLEIFRNYLLTNQSFQEYLAGLYRHLVFDNLEEDTPVTIDLLHWWLPHFDSALLIYDLEAGYRRFLGADPHYALSLADACHNQVNFNESFTTSAPVQNLGAALARALEVDGDAGLWTRPPTLGSDLALIYPNPALRLYPEMLDWVADQASLLIDQGTPPGEIVVLAPYLSDALRYALMDRFERLGIPTHSHRPSRSLREEPATRCLLTLTMLAYPQWGFRPQPSDLAHTLMQAIDTLDLVRAQILVQYLFRGGSLIPFDQLDPRQQERVTYTLGNRYDRLRGWLEELAASDLPELDHFISRLFGEVLSQPGYGFHQDFTAAGIVASLVESVQKFRRVAGGPLADEGIPLGQEYLHMVADGVIASQYLLPWQENPQEAVFLAPAYTFLMANRPVDFQFWLDVGGRGWYERLYQPITHPYVLSRNWPLGHPWTDTHETQASRQALYTLTSGLIRRCRRGIFLGLSDLGESGFESKGELLVAFDRAIRSTRNRL